MTLPIDCHMELNPKTQIYPLQGSSAALSSLLACKVGLLLPQVRDEEGALTKAAWQPAPMGWKGAGLVWQPKVSELAPRVGNCTPDG